MNRNGIQPPAIVRAVEDLSALAKRVREREKKNRSGQLEHVKKQAADVLAARQAAKHGEWLPWCKEAGLSQVQAWRYAEFWKSFVTNDLSSLPEDEQWVRWQRLSGNSPPEPQEETPYGGWPDLEVNPEPTAKVEPDDSESDEDTGGEEEEQEEPNNNRTAYLLWADEATRLAAECRKMATKINATHDVKKIARRAVAAWADLVTYLES